MADEISVTVIYEAEDKKLEVDLPTNIPVSRLLSWITTKMGLSQDTSYALRWDKKLLPREDTLNNAGVRAGSTLYLLASHTDHVLVQVNQRWIIELPTGIPINHILPVLTKQMHFPISNVDIPVQHVQSGRLLQGDDILSDVDIKNGDTLHILPGVTDIGHVVSDSQDSITIYCKVIVKEASRYQEFIVELPADEPVSGLLPTLAAKMQLSNQSSKIIQHIRSGRLLRGDDVLSDVGCKEGDRLHLMPDIGSIGTIAATNEEPITLYNEFIVTDVSQNKKVIVELPINDPVSHFLPTLAARMNLSGDIQYAIQHMRSGKLVHGSDTLSRSGVKEGNTLCLVPDPTITSGSPSKIKVTVTDPAGGKTVTAELPADATMSRLLPTLVTKMRLPNNVQYSIAHWQTRRQLYASDTLASAGVSNGDTLRLLPDVTAGGPGGGFITLFGESFTAPPKEVYRCEVGPHFVPAVKVAQKDVSGRPLCPEHHTVMTLEPAED